MPPDPSHAADCAAIVAADGAADPRALAAADRLAAAALAAAPSVRDAACRALFAGVVEPLNDGLDPAGRERYARYFGRVVWCVAEADPELGRGLSAHGIASEEDLLARHRRLRTAAGRWVGAPRRLAVLSRVTLGADVLLTTVLLQHLRATWPAAAIVLYGDPKLGGLLGGFPGLEVRALPYSRRGGLRERLRAWLPLAADVGQLAPDLLVAPDSRLDQLGLLPLVPEERHLLWENLEGEPPRPLASLLDAWCRERFSPVADRLAPRLWFDPATVALRDRLAAALGPAPVAAVKLDHGGNSAKALPPAAERLFLAGLRDRGWRVLLDRGFGAEEIAHGDALVADLGWEAVDLDDAGGDRGRPVDRLAPGSLATAPVVRFHGSIAGWAAALAGCGLALSYDSVGHHLAAALGVPLVTAFTGHAVPAFPVAWHPCGPGRVTQVVIPTGERDDPRHWERVLAALPAADAGPAATGGAAAWAGRG